MQVIWTLAARTDAVDIRSFISEVNPQAANQMVRRIVAAGNVLETFPERGRPTGVVGVRELVVGNTPYLLVYRVVGKAVEILRVWHEARDRS